MNQSILNHIAQNITFEDLYLHKVFRIFAHNKFIIVQRYYNEMDDRKAIKEDLIIHNIKGIELNIF